jgi:hypothetical protein
MIRCLTPVEREVVEQQLVDPRRPLVGCVVPDARSGAKRFPPPLNSAVPSTAAQPRVSSHPSDEQGRHFGRATQMILAGSKSGRDGSGPAL